MSGVLALPRPVTHPRKDPLVPSNLSVSAPASPKPHVTQERRTSNRGPSASGQSPIEVVPGLQRNRSNCTKRPRSRSMQILTPPSKRRALANGVGEIRSIDLSADRLEAHRIGAMMSESFLAVDEPFALYIEPDRKVLEQKLPLHFKALNDYLAALGGRCVSMRDHDGREMGVVSWIHPKDAVGEEAAAQASEAYKNRMYTLWGQEAGDRYFAGYKPCDEVTTALLGKMGDPRALSIELFAVPSGRTRKGSGAAMLSRFINDPAVVGDATHVSAATETAKGFWNKMGVKEQGGVAIESAGKTIRGFEWSVHVGTVGDVRRTLQQRL
jgi:hypothetical protein